MKVTEYIANANSKTLVSFEILPPLKGKSFQSICDVLDPLMEFKPPFINVTYHRSETKFKKMADGRFDKVAIRKRPGTVGICAAIMNKYGVDAVPHLICGGFTIEETEDALIDLDFLGIQNILCLRGDAPHGETQFTPEIGGHHHAIDLLKQAERMNNGIYLEDDLKNPVKTNFSLGVAGYPEKHSEAPNMTADLKQLKAKVDAGAQFIVTQMFFDNKKYFEFVDACRKMEINVPIIPGLKPLTTFKQLTVLPRTFNVNLPDDLVNEIMKAKGVEEKIFDIGVEWCAQQSIELKKAGAPVIHYYTMSNIKAIKTIAQQVF
jgi:methylenetetrahydrofolate reductase (NADPH)